jgi:hypothetical protein
MINSRYADHTEDVSPASFRFAEESLCCALCDGPVSSKDEFCQTCGAFIRPPRGLKLVVTAGLFVISSAFFVLPLLFWKVGRLFKGTASKFEN